MCCKLVPVLLTARLNQLALDSQLIIKVLFMSLISVIQEVVDTKYFIIKPVCINNEVQKVLSQHL